MRLSVNDDTIIIKYVKKVSHIGLLYVKYYL